MPKNAWIDRNTATTFRLVHRAQNDARIHDENASAMVFTEVANTNKKQKRAKTRHDLEQELHLDNSSIRRNEGEAANYGVFFDDTAYDYMQHIRDIGADGEGYFIEAVPGDGDPKTGKGKGKGKGRGKQQTLDEALRDATLEDLQQPNVGENGDRGNASVAGASGIGGVRLDPDILPSAYVRNSTYQDQQDVPDALAGFQPDMDPRLREVLEALEDEAYVADDAEEDTFAELASGDNRELSLDEFEHYADAAAEDQMDRDNGEEEDDGWQTDDTAKPGRIGTSAARKPTMDGDVAMESSNVGEESSDNNWMAEYNKFKRAERGGPGALAMKEMKEEGPRTDARRGPGHVTSNALSSSVITGSSYLAGGRRKKRKGAMTSSTSYSMSSASLVRTEGLTLLDDRFEQLEKLYALDEDEEGDEDGYVASSASSVVSRSVAPSAADGSARARSVRTDLDSLMDDFLGTYTLSGSYSKKRVRRLGGRGGQQSGLEQLDEIRRELGPAHIRPSKPVSMNC